MSRRRYSRIAHEGIRFWNPLDEQELVHVLRVLPLTAGARVLDYGSGEGEVLVELARHHDVRVTGVDPNPDAIERCRRKVAGEYFVEEFSPDRFAPRSFDLIVNLGASPGLARLLAQIVPLLRAEGRVLIGDGYWQRPPCAEYLAFLGETGGELPSHDDNLARFRAAGLEVERSCISDRAAWDHYEDRYDANMRRHLTEHPDDTDAAVFEDRRRSWRDMYLRHGRGTMGFALYQARLI